MVVHGGYAGRVGAARDLQGPGVAHHFELRVRESAPYRADRGQREDEITEPPGAHDEDMFDLLQDG